MNHVKLLHISYWLGAIADFIYGIIVLIPSRVGVSEYVYPMGLFAAVAFSWGIMLILANRCPLERRWILIPTMIVIILLGIANLHSLIIGAIGSNVVIPRLLLKLGIVIFMLFSYIKTGEKETK